MIYVEKGLLEFKHLHIFIINNTFLCKSKASQSQGVLLSNTDMKEKTACLLATGLLTVENVLGRNQRGRECWLKLVYFLLGDTQSPYVYSDLKRPKDEYFKASCIERNRSQTACVMQ